MLLEATAPTITSVMEDIGSVLSGAVEWLGTVMDTVMGSPVLFIMCIGIPVSLFGVNLLRRLISL